MLMRVRLIALTTVALFLAAWGWSFAPWDDLLDQRGKPLGADFPQFYIFGRAVLEASANFYSGEAQQQELQQIFPGIAPYFYLPLWYPPFIGILCAPLALLPYWLAFFVYCLFSVALYAYSVSHLASKLPAAAPSKRTVVLAAISAPVCLEALIGGQLSLIAASIVNFVCACLLQSRFVLAGALLACGLYKPNVMVFFIFGCLCRYPQILRGFLPSVFLLAAVSLAMVGPEGLEEYFDVLVSLLAGTRSTGTPEIKMVGLSSWLKPFLPVGTGMMLFFVGCAGVLLWERLSRARESDAPTIIPYLSGLLVLNALLNPYLPIYDVSLLVPAALLFVFSGSRAAATIGQSRFGVHLLVGSYCAAHLSQALAGLGLPQFFPLLLVSWMMIIARDRWAPAEHPGRHA